MQSYNMNMVTKPDHLQVMPFQMEYITEEGVVHAPLLFKTIMRITTTNNIEAVAVLRDNLHNLDAKMVELNSDLAKFHFYYHTNYDHSLDVEKL